MSFNAFFLVENANTFVVSLIRLGIGLVLTIIIATLVGRTLKQSFARLTKKIKVEATQFLVLRRIIVALIYVFGITMSLSSLPGFENAWLSILTGAGVLAVVVGFAAQKTFSNIVSGLFIAIFRPFRVGDKITIKNEYGTVEDITLMHTIIETAENRRVIIPNSIVSDETIVNYSLGEKDTAWSVDVGISYDSDIDKARKIMLEEANKHPEVGKATKTLDFIEKGQQCVVRVTALKDFSVNMNLTFWAHDYPTAVKTGWELLESIKKRFDREAIEIPFPYRTIVYKKNWRMKN